MGNADVNNDGQTTLHELTDFLQQTYCGSVGVEIEHLRWVRERGGEALLL